MQQGAVKYFLAIAFLAGLVAVTVMQTPKQPTSPQTRAYAQIDGSNPPYDENVDARAAVKAGRGNAVADRRFLMITFGANWCPDCRNLHRSLGSRKVAEYTEGLFYFVNVDVGQFDQNADIVAELGVTLARGIPVAIFFDIDGRIIGTTNEGQLEPSRYYSSQQILGFMRGVAEQSRILAPDAVR